MTGGERRAADSGRKQVDTDHSSESGQNSEDGENSNTEGGEGERTAGPRADEERTLKTLKAVDRPRAGEGLPKWWSLELGEQARPGGPRLSSGQRAWNQAIYNLRALNRKPSKRPCAGGYNRYGLQLEPVQNSHPYAQLMLRNESRMVATAHPAKQYPAIDARRRALLDERQNPDSDFQRKDYDNARYVVAKIGSEEGREGSLIVRGMGVEVYEGPLTEKLNEVIKPLRNERNEPPQEEKFGLLNGLGVLREARSLGVS